MENLYWNIENYTSNVIALLEESKDKIFAQKLTIKDIEKHFNKKVCVCPKNENPHLIVNAMLEKNGVKYYDRRKSLRGSTYRCFLFV